MSSPLSFSSPDDDSDASLLSDEPEAATSQTASPHRIHDLPADDRPRERLLRLGAQALTDAELLAIFINTGIKGENAIQVGQRLLREFDTLRGISRQQASALAKVKALGPAKAAHLAAAFELGRRAEQQWVQEMPMNTPEQIHRYLGAEMAALPYESMRLILLNTRMMLLRQEEVFRGSLSETTAHPRDLFERVLTHRAHAFVVVHNHPSGDPMPSEADRRFTRRLREGAELLGVKFLDHLILGTPSALRAQGYFSFREAGMIG